MKLLVALALLGIAVATPVGDVEEQAEGVKLAERACGTYPTYYCQQECDRQASSYCNSVCGGNGSCWSSCYNTKTSRCYRCCSNNCITCS